MTNVEKQFYSQYGEDRLLEEIFFEVKSGVCLEVGGYDGITGSTTLFFENKGWRSIVIEPMPDFCEKIRQVRNCEIVQAAASDQCGEAIFFVAQGVETLSTLERDKNIVNRVGWEGGHLKEVKVQKHTLDKILENLMVERIDFITIDVEGHEMAVLKGLTLHKYRPRVIIIEDNSHGLSRDIKNYMKGLGYCRFKITGCNDWYAQINDKQLINLKAVLTSEIKSAFKILEATIKAPIKAILTKKQIDSLIEFTRK